MGMENGLTLVFAVALAGCTAPAAQVGNQALRASDAAQRLGVERYRIELERVVLLGATGELGTMVISAPSGDRRLVKIALTDRRTYESELSRPTADGQFVVYSPGDSIRTAVETDPALAAAFAEHQIVFLAASLAAEAPAASALAPELWATCGDGSASTDPPPCNSPCFQDGDCSLDGSGSNWSTAHRVCYCPPVYCPRNDVVWRSVSCSDPGSCSRSTDFVDCL